MESLTKAFAKAHSGLMPNNDYAGSALAFLPKGIGMCTFSTWPTLYAPITLACCPSPNLKIARSRLVTHSRA